MTNKPNEEQAIEILRRPYSRVLVPQEEGGFTAEILEFPGCFAEGESAEETYANLEDAARSWVLACLEKGDPIPAPLTTDVSGKFALRLPRSLYARASKAAAKEGISLNQFIVNAVAERIGEVNVIDRLEKLLSHVKRPTYHVRITKIEKNADTSVNQSSPKLSGRLNFSAIETASN